MILLGQRNVSRGNRQTDPIHEARIAQTGDRYIPPPPSKQGEHIPERARGVGSKEDQWCPGRMLAQAWDQREIRGIERAFGQHQNRAERQLGGGVQNRGTTQGAGEQGDEGHANLQGDGSLYSVARIGGAQGYRAPYPRSEDSCVANQTAASRPRLGRSLAFSRSRPFDSDLRSSLGVTLLAFSPSIFDP